MVVAGTYCGKRRVANAKWRSPIRAVGDPFALRAAPRSGRVRRRGFLRSEALRKGESDGNHHISSITSSTLGEYKSFWATGSKMGAGALFGEDAALSRVEVVLRSRQGSPPARQI